MSVTVTDVRHAAGRLKRRVAPRVLQARRRSVAHWRLRTALAGLSADERWLVRQADAVLTAAPQASVAVLVGPDPGRLPDVLRVGYPHARLTVVPVDATAPSRHARLAAGGRYRLMIDAGTAVDDPAALLRSVLFHLERGGRFVDAAHRPDLPAPRGVGPLLAHLDAVRAGTADPTNADDAALAAAVREVAVDGRRLSVTNGTAALAKLRDADADHVIAARGPRFGAVLLRVGPTTLHPRGTITDHAVTSSRRTLAPYEVPPLSLRAHPDVVCTRRQVAVKGNVALPDTYRKDPQPRLINLGTTELAPDFAAPIKGARTAPRLEGTYFAWDDEHPGHFGHVLTEQVSRLWAWDAARAVYPDLKPLVSRYHWRSEMTGAEAGVLEALGVDPADTVRITGPTRVERLVGATPQFCMPYYVSPDIADVWGRLGPAVAARSERPDHPARIFSSRRGGTRECVNQAEVEQLFAEHGFTIVYPAELPFAEQVALFRHADVVAGFAGSNMFQLMFTDAKPVILLSSETYDPKNEYMIAAVLGHPIDVFWSVPETAHTSSPFRLDPDREGRLLRRHLASL